MDTEKKLLRGNQKVTTNDMTKLKTKALPTVLKKPTKAMGVSKRKNRGMVGNQTEENTKNIAVMTNDLGYIKSQIDVVDRKIDTIMKQVPSRSEFNSLKDDVEGLEADKVWLYRIVISAVLLGVIDLLITFSG